MNAETPREGGLPESLAGQPDSHQRTASGYQRTAFTTSRLLDYFTEKELVAQTGARRDDWPLVVLKELVDNALDACEEAGTAPKIDVTIDQAGITVTDNGPGIPSSTVEAVVDFSVRVSSREAYVAPDRGAQGNALKTVAAIPFVLDGDQGRVDIIGADVAHQIEVTVDPIEQRPVIDHRQRPDGSSGTTVTVYWPDSSGSTLRDSWERFLQLAGAYVFVNPHVDLTVEWYGETVRIPATATDWSKWSPDEPTSVHWYQPAHLERLVAAYVAADRHSNGDRSVREFVAGFKGLSGTAKTKTVLDATGLARTRLSDLANGRLDSDTIAGLLTAMKDASAPVKPARLGVIGRDHFQTRFDALGCEPESFTYKKATGTTDGLPWVVEAAFGWCPDLARRRLVTGVNWSPAIGNPFRELGFTSLDGVLGEQRAGFDEPVMVAVHLATPRVEHTDRGKSAVVIDFEIAGAICETVEAVTRKWAKQRKAEERHHQAQLRRQDAMTRTRQVTIKQAAWHVMADAYHQAQGRPGLPANARQIFYKARPEILRLTGKNRLDSAYFTQTLLPDYINEHPEIVGSWDVVYDARGHLREPHTEHTVALGTVEVRDYLAGFDSGTDSGIAQLDLGYPTKGPTDRYANVLFMEKEGFDELLASARLAERFDLAVMSTKGLSVVAARQLVDSLAGQGVRLFVAHDLDKAGFSILATLTGDSDRYTFTNHVDVTDLGVRLDDVHAYGLESEAVSYGNQNRWAVEDNLRDNGATDDEIELLVDQGRRVELNAFASDQLVEWLESKLVEHGVAKVVPHDDTLATAYRRAVVRAEINRRITEIHTAANDDASMVIPNDLGDQVTQILDSDPTLAWDQAIAEIVEGGPT